MSSAHSQVLETPELLSIICGHAQLGACATLLRVNKSIFRAAVPFVWESVNQVSHLLQLIPGFVDSGVIALPPFVDADFTRFAVYAQYVRSLAVNCRLRVTPWKTLILQSKQRPLLPQLQFLCLWQLSNQPGFVTEGIAWMAVLLTQSLTSVDIRRTGPISISGISVLLHMISDSCLNLRKLCLPSVLESTELEDGEHHLLDILPNQSLPGSFLSFSSLRALTSSHWVLRPECFQTLGDLPQLESLELFPEPSVINLPGSVLLHENSFPALKRLSLRQLSWNRIGIILKHQLLIKNIVSLELVAILTSDSWEEADAALLELVNIENLTNLVIDFNDQDCYEIYPDNPSLEILSQLPLRSVKLVQAQFMAIDQIRFPRIFPTLTELRVLYQSADLVEFSRFATIPNLKHLVFRAWDLRATDLTASVKLPVCPSLDTLQVTTGFSYPFPVQEVHTIARYFRKLFPNLKKITWLNGAGDTVADRDMTLLNAYIAMLRERSNARARVAEQCGWDVANQLLPDDDESIRPVV